MVSAMPLQALRALARAPAQAAASCRSSSSGGRRRVPPPATALRVLLLLALSSPVLAAYGSGKKSKFLAAYPMLFKFFLFWWCIFVFVVMGFYIVDHLMYKRWGPAKVQYSREHTFKGGLSRQTYWAQFADPSTWSVSHPILQTADVRMVSCAERATSDSTDGEKEANGEKSDSADYSKKEDGEFGVLEQTLKLEPVPLGPLAEKLGLIMRHKEGNGPRSGTFFCTRECTKLETPAKGPWRLVMLTVEIGNGYPYQERTEETEIELHEPAEDGSVRCVIKGFASVKSRIFRWWNSLEVNSKQGAEMMMQAIEDELMSSKKKD